MKFNGFTTDAHVHDPAVRKGPDGRYYLFGTHMTSAVSDDLRHFTMLTKENVSPSNTLFRGLFETEAFDFCGKFDGKVHAVWAPDVMWFPERKRWLMYFCTSGSYVRSSICLASSENITGPYHFEKVLLSSGFTAETGADKRFYELMGSDASVQPYLRKNGSYNNFSWPNCIDPNLTYDRDGRLWMVYGSWSGGIFLLEIDRKTGDIIHPEPDEKHGVDRYFGRHLLGGGHKSHEGPYLVYDSVSDWYYLFVSFGWLANTGGYQVRLFRSRNVDGPYTDMNGKGFGRVPDHSGYGLKLIGNHELPGLERGCMAPGHNSVLQDDDGSLYMVCHQRFEGCGDWHEPRVRQLYRTADGWLTLSPYQMPGHAEPVTELTADAAEGTWDLLCHGLDISGEIHRPAAVICTAAGELTGEDGGRGRLICAENGWTGLEWQGRSYNGACFQAENESGERVLCVSAVGGNESIWMVKRNG